jgi:hypothetical protein
MPNADFAIGVRQRGSAGNLPLPKPVKGVILHPKRAVIWLSV